MAQYQVQDPQGNMHVIEGPENAKPDEILAQAQRLLPSAPTKPPEKGMFGQTLDPAPHDMEERGISERSPNYPTSAMTDASVDVALTTQGVYGLSKLAGRGGMAVIKSAASQAPNIVEKFGARGVLSSIGITPKTLQKLAGNLNPEEVGVKLGQQLVKEGAVGSTVSGTYDKARLVKKSYGKAVDGALTAIQKANKSLGVYPELSDALKVDSNKVLKPILDSANELRDSGYPLERFASKYRRAMYNSLAKAAEEGKGFLTLDNIRSEMQKVGKMFNKTAPDSDNYHIVSDLYSTLADTRDSMIREIAEQVGNPALAKNLLDANKGYSLYTRILPDISTAVAKEATGSTGIFRAPMKAAGQALETPISKAAVSVGGLPRKIARKFVGK